MTEQEIEKKFDASLWTLTECPTCGHKQYDRGDPDWADYHDMVAFAKWHCDACWGTVVSNHASAVADGVRQDDATRDLVLSANNNVRKIWLDDVRPAPEGWVWMKTPWGAITELKKGDVTVISLDNDLQLTDAEGYDVVKWIEEQVHTLPGYAPPAIHVHTMNPVARRKMFSGIEAIERYLSR